MALRALNLVGHQVQCRNSSTSCSVSMVDHMGGTQRVWRSVCGPVPVKQATCQGQRMGFRCAALAPPHSPPLWDIDTGCEDVMGRLRDTEHLKNCLGASLTEDEQRSLVRCLDSASLGVDTCLVDGLEALRDHLMSYIEAVSVSQTDDLELVEGAMLLIEQLSQALGGATSPSSTSSTSTSSTSSSSSSSSGQQGLLQQRFSGQWQVLVTTGGGWPYGRLQYVPIIELLDISEDGRQFRLESKAGPLFMAASGEVTWRQEPFHLHYHATEFRMEVGGLGLTLPPPAPDNDLRVFAMSPGGTTALARSALGGMQLMVRPV